MAGASSLFGGSVLGGIEEIEKFAHRHPLVPQTAWIVRQST